MNRRQEKLKKAQAELSEIDGAISAILSGAQEYRIGSRSVHRADLETLYKRKDSLESLVDALEGGGSGFKRVVPIG